MSLYAGADCSGLAVVAGPASYFALPGGVAAANSTQAPAPRPPTRGNASACSAPMTYVEDSIIATPPPGPDTQAPETTITHGPKKQSSKRKVSFAFASTEQGSSFECSLDGRPFEACQSPLTLKVTRARHSFEVRATDAAGNTDATPAAQKFKVTKKR